MSLEVDLREFAKSLKPTVDQQHTFNAAVDDLNQELGKIFHQDRLIPGGSYAKGTSLGFHMDLDLLVYLNEESPPFRQINRRIANAIESGFDKGSTQGKRIQAGNYTVSFLYSRNGQTFDIDIVPVQNVVKGQHRENIQKSQYHNTLEAMKNMNEEERRGYRAGLTEATIEFIKRQSSDIHELIRLAKCWLFGNIEKKMPGGISSLIETIAVHAGDKVEKGGGKFSMTDGFRQFLSEMKDVKQLHIIFDKESTKLKVGYGKSDIPSQLLSQCPLVLDPVDAFNNRLEPFEDDVLDTLEKKARETLSRWKSTSSLEGILRPQRTSDDYDKITAALQSYRIRAVATSISSLSLGGHSQGIPTSSSWGNSTLEAYASSGSHQFIICDHVTGPGRYLNFDFALRTLAVSALRNELAGRLGASSSRIILRQYRKTHLDQWAVQVSNTEVPMHLFATQDGNNWSIKGIRRECFHLSDGETLKLASNRRCVIVALEVGRAASPAKVNQRIKREKAD